MRKAPRVYREDDVVLSFDAAAFVNAVSKVAADVASGRITPAEARALLASRVERSGPPNWRSNFVLCSKRSF